MARDESLLFSKLHDEVYARVQWGEDRHLIRDWLVHENRLTEGQADALIRDAMKDRAMEVRLHGLRSIGVGASIFLGCAIAALCLLWAQSAPWAHRYLRSIFFTLFAGAVAGCLLGIYKIVRGILQTIDGRAEGSITDL